jgi:phospholipid/cholesterol/gamma-HCH transport system permease protein
LFARFLLVFVFLLSFVVQSFGRWLADSMNAITRPLENLGRTTAAALAGIGHAAMLLLESLYFAAVGWKQGQPVRLRSVAEQMRQVGVDALPIVAMLAFTIGIMLGIQFIAALSEFGAQSQVVVAVAKSVTREFGALITAILVAGRSGSSLAARIGSMTVSQEVDALAVIGIDPVRYLAAPALIAMLVMLPVLTVFADVVAICGAALYSSPALNVTPAAYVMQTLALLTPGDLWQGISKAFVFAVLICLIGISTGFSVSGGAEGVGRATTRAVVLSICYIIVADMIFSFFLNR